MVRLLPGVVGYRYVLQGLGVVILSNYEVEINGERKVIIAISNLALPCPIAWAGGVLLWQRLSHKGRPKPLLAQVFEP